MGIAGYLGYVLFNSVQEPILEKQERDIRTDATVAKLKTIRAAQLAYKLNTGKYVSTFDSLVDFVKTGKYTVLKKIPNKEMSNDTIQVFDIDTSYVSVLDSLFKGNTAELNELMKVPYTDTVFVFKSGNIIKNETPIPAFEAKVRYGALYNGMIEKYYANIQDKFLQVGSMVDGTTTGNWEK